jgi:hypothetical protein
MPGHCCFEGDFADRIFADGFLQTAFLQMDFADGFFCHFPLLISLPLRRFNASTLYHSKDYQKSTIIMNYLNTLLH